MEKPRLSVSSENTSQKMFIGKDKISEIVNYLDSDGGNFSKHSDTFKVNSPLSSSSSSRSGEQEVPSQNLAEARKRKHRVELLEFASDYSHSYAVSVQMSWDRFLALLTMF
jgi:hypothetical protein